MRSRRSELICNVYSYWTLLRLIEGEGELLQWGDITVHAYPIILVPEISCIRSVDSLSNRYHTI